MDLTSRLRSSRAASSFTESVIREMTRLAQVHDAINLGQGFPDFPAPGEVKEAAARAIAEDHNQYPITWGVPAFREAIAATYARDYGMTIDPETEICVTCGATEAMSAAFLGLLDPGDEVVVFEPFYESYGPDAILSGARLRYVTLRPPDWAFDPDELAAAFGAQTRAIVVGSPHNPTGKVFTREELSQIARAVRRERRHRDHRRDLRAHHLRRGGARADRDASGDGRSHRHDQRAVQDVRGDRLARRVGDRGPAVDGRHPFDARLPYGGGRDTVAAGRGGRARAARRVLRADAPPSTTSGATPCCASCTRRGSPPIRPPAPITSWPTCRRSGFDDDVAAARHLVEEVGVAAVPGSSFFSEPSLGAHLLRFAFPKKLETLEEAGQRLRKAASSSRPGARMLAGSKAALRRAPRAAETASVVPSPPAPRTSGAMPPSDATRSRTRPSAASSSHGTHA